MDPFPRCSIGISDYKTVNGIDESEQADWVSAPHRYIKQVIAAVSLSKRCHDKILPL